MVAVMQAPTSVLDPKVHAPILRDFDNVCSVAGVQPKFMRESMVGVCGESEVHWVRNFRALRAAGNPGLLITKAPNPDSRCQAICAALVRNFIDARTIPLNTVLDLHEKGDLPAPSVLLIPNLYIHTIGKSLQAYKVQQMYDLLLSRSVQNKPTVVYVEKMEGLAGAYGAPFHDFLSNFTQA